MALAKVVSLGQVNPISESEIAMELYNRNYTTGSVSQQPTTTPTRQECITAAVNKGLDYYGYPRKASTLTYIDVITYSNLIAYCKEWANKYLTGQATISASVISGLGGNMARRVKLGLSGLGQTTTLAVTIPPAPQAGFSGWGLLLTLVGQGLITYGNYLMYKQMMTQQGYSFPPLQPGVYEYYGQQLHSIDPKLTQQQIDEILRPYQPKQETPTWVWVAGGVMVLYLLMQRQRQ